MTDKYINEFFWKDLDTWLLSLSYMHKKFNCYTNIKIEVPQEIIDRIPHINNLVYECTVNKDNTVVEMWNGVGVTFTSSLKCE